MSGRRPSDLDELRGRVRAFVEERIVPVEEHLHAEGEHWHLSPVFARLKQEAKVEGLWALGHPKEIGGGGVPFVPFVYLNEVIGRSEWGQRVLGTASMQDSIMLYRFGAPEQRERWLAPLVAGEIIQSVGLTEPEVAGSDPTQMRATATLDGDQWVVNGHKWFTTHANRAAFTTVFCRTEPEDVGPHRRFSAIIVPTDVEGFEVVRIVPTMGSTAAGHCEIRLTDCRVPASNLLGERGQGFSIAQQRLGPGRIFHVMRWLGQAQRALELMCARAKNRWVHGSLLSEKGEIRQMIAESVSDIATVRLMALDAARLMDEGSDARLSIALAKVRGARMLHDVVDRAIQVHGGLGVTADTPLERMYREARFARILDGPDEVHRMVIARTALVDGRSGLPWE